MFDTDAVGIRPVTFVRVATVGRDDTFDVPRATTAASVGWVSNANTAMHITPPMAQVFL